MYLNRQTYKEAEEHIMKYRKIGKERKEKGKI
jgi:hypothetical protein